MGLATGKGSLFLVALVLVVLASLYFVVVPPPQNSVQISVGSAEQIGLTEDIELLYANATILEVLSGHAWQNHGTEVNDAIRCLNDKGSTMSFKTYGFKDANGKPIKTNLWLCRDGDDWYAIITTALEKVGGNRIGRLITAYLVDNKRFMVIDDFIKAIEEKWSAVQINFQIPADSVFLQPR